VGTRPLGALRHCMKYERAPRANSAGNISNEEPAWLLFGSYSMSINTGSLGHHRRNLRDPRWLLVRPKRFELLTPQIRSFVQTSFSSHWPDAILPVVAK
jgi:hypothetical protein